MTSASCRTEAGYYSTIFREKVAGPFLVDQDLSIAKEKVFAINKAVRDLNLTVCNPDGGYSRFTSCEVLTTYEDGRFKSTERPRRHIVWQPRVIMFYKTELKLQEVQEDE